MSFVLMLLAAVYAPTSAAQADAMIYYVRSSAHEFAQEWYCGTGNEQAVRRKAVAALSSKVTSRQVNLLMGEFDRELSRMGYDIAASSSKREEAHAALKAQCDRDILSQLKAEEETRLDYIDHPERMEE